MTDPTPTETTDQQASAEPEKPDMGDKDWSKEAEKWKALARKHEEAAKTNAGAAKRITEIEEASKTETQKLAERAEAAEKAAAAAQREMSRLRVLSEVSLPADLHEFVVGDDEDELRAKAQKLAAQFTAEQRSVDVGQGPRGSTVAPDMNTFIRQAAGRA